MTRAREAFKRMQTIRIQRPEDSALVRAMAGAFFQADGTLEEAEAEYLAAIHAWAEAGRGETADAGAILNSLGSLYIDEHRLDDARGVLDRALIIFNHATDAVPMDRIKLLALWGVLHARQSEWQEAEKDFSDALSIADRESKVDPLALQSLLVNYGIVLRKNHHRREAHSIEARAAALRRDHMKDVVDVTAVFAKRRLPENSPRCGLEYWEARDSCSGALPRLKPIRDPVEPTCRKHGGDWHTHTFFSSCTPTPNIRIQRRSNGNWSACRPT